MIASLGMYDFPEIRGAVDALWGLIRDSLRDQGMKAPEQLTRGDGAYWQAWEAPDLVLSQTCGLPFRAKLHDRVTLIGTPDYGVEGCSPGYYRSVFLARQDDHRRDVAEFAGAPFAYNEALSQSGWAAPLSYFKKHGLALNPVRMTGSHRSSIEAVLSGAVDFAAIDAVTWAFLKEIEPASRKVRVVGLTVPTPGLPLIAAMGQDAEKTRAAVDQAIAALSSDQKTTLRLHGFVHIPASDYLAQPIPAAPDQIAHSF